jgi:hypothetical protein
MSFGKQKSSQKSGLDPQIREAFLGNVNRATGVADQLGARQFAGFTPDQTTAFDIVRQFASPTSAGMQQVSQGASAIQGASTYQPQMVSGQQVSAQGFGGAQIDPIERILGQQVSAQGYGGATIDPAAQAMAEQASRAGIRDVSSATGASGMQAYFNPFEDQVVQGALGDIERSRQMQQMQGSAQAQRAGAFGGSRQGVAESLTNEAALRQSANTAAQLRSQGFQTAAGLGQQDAARALQAQMSNQGVDMSLEQANAQLRQQVGLSNQDAINRRAMEQAGMSQQAGMFSATAQNQAAQRQAELAQQASMSNQQLAAQRASEQAGLQQQAGLFSATAQNEAAQRQAELAQQADLANQQAGLQGSQQRMQAGSQLADVGALTQNLGFTQAAQLGQIGEQQQGFSQAQLDAIRNLPMEQQQIINEALGLNPAGGSGGVSSGRSSGFNMSLGS